MSPCELHLTHTLPDDFYECLDATPALNLLLYTFAHNVPKGLGLIGIHT